MILFDSIPLVVLCGVTYVYAYESVLRPVDPPLFYYCFYAKETRDHTGRGLFGFSYIFFIFIILVGSG